MTTRIQVRKMGVRHHPWIVGCPRCPGWPNLRGPSLNGVNSVVGWRSQPQALRYALEHAATRHWRDHATVLLQDSARLAVTGTAAGGAP